MEPQEPPSQDSVQPVKARKPERTRWNKYAKHLIQLEMLKQDITFQQLTGMLVELEPTQKEYWSDTLSTLIGRGTFKFALALQILRALGVNSLDISQLPSKAKGASKARS